MPHSEQLPGYAPVALRYAGGYAATEELISRATRERIWESIYIGGKLCEFLRINVLFLLVIGPRVATAETFYIFVAVVMSCNILLQHRWQGYVVVHTRRIMQDQCRVHQSAFSRICHPRILSFLCLY